MLINLKLQNFRNFEKKAIEFDKTLTVITGLNASGKTNILESIFMLATGKSFKAKLEKEVIKHNTDIARLRSESYDGQASIILEIVITTGENGWPKKKMVVNGVPRRLIDFSGNLKVVLFAPQDLDLVTQAPSLRRKFLDNVLSQSDREYKRSIGSYEKGLRQRNKLLLRIREEGVNRSHLLFWNQLLIKNGDYVSNKRNEFIDFCNSHHTLSTNHYSLEYDRSAISEGRLEQYKNEEIAAATTLVGPHRDDFVFLIHHTLSTNHQSLASFGSRGEQRMGVLWLKMAEFAYIEQFSENKPLLLLDDIFSELDHNHRKIVMNMIKNRQTVMTTADKHFLNDFKNDDITLIEL